MSRGIAVIGMAGRFPGAVDVDSYWENLLAGRESIIRLTDEELLESGVPEHLLKDRHYVKAASVLSDPYGFDAAFFGYTPREAGLIDPQQRLLLECAWEALESAGYAGDGRPDATGVFAGSSMNTYLLHSGLAAHFFDDWVMLLSCSDKDFLASRIAYKCDLRGAAVSLQTACSTSLVAVHYACQGLLSGELDMALAGGVCVKFPHRAGYLWREGGMFSRDGHCRSFDAEASGTIFGSGAGLVVLKRLDDAVRDRDYIHAVILGSAVNNDGAAKGTYASPSIERQADVIVEALADANAEASSISMFEAHGTATSIGDPIEIGAATRAYRQQTDRERYCALGSVKSNIGHIESAAGIAGFIKAVLALRERVLPASLYFSKPNPGLGLDSSPFFVNTETRLWPTEQGLPRRAAVNALGVGGTNAHIVLEEPPPRPPRPAEEEGILLPVSARDEASFRQLSAALAGHLRKPDAPSLRDVGATLMLGRKHFPRRGVAFASDHLEAARQLESLAQGEAWPGHNFLHPGGRMGALWAQGELHRLEPPGAGWGRVPLPGHPFQRKTHRWKP